MPPTRSGASENHATCCARRPARRGGTWHQRSAIHASRAVSDLAVSRACHISARPHSAPHSHGPVDFLLCQGHQDRRIYRSERFTPDEPQAHRTAPSAPISRGPHHRASLQPAGTLPADAQSRGMPNFGVTAIRVVLRYWRRPCGDRPGPIIGLASGVPAPGAVPTTASRRNGAHGPAPHAPPRTIRPGPLTGTGDRHGSRAFRHRPRAPRGICHNGRAICLGPGTSHGTIMSRFLAAASTDLVR